MAIVNDRPKTKLGNTRFSTTGSMSISEFKDFFKSHERVTMPDGASGHRWTLSSFQLAWSLFVTVISLLTIISGVAYWLFEKHQALVKEARADERIIAVQTERLELGPTKLALGTALTKNRDLEATLIIRENTIAELNSRLENSKRALSNSERQFTEASARVDELLDVERRLRRELAVANNRKLSAIDDEVNQRCAAMLASAKAELAESETRCRSSQVPPAGQGTASTLNLNNRRLQAATITKGEVYRRPSGDLIHVQYVILSQERIMLRIDNSDVSITLGDKKSYGERSSSDGRACFIRLLRVYGPTKNPQADIEHWCE